MRFAVFVLCFSWLIGVGFAGAQDSDSQRAMALVQQGQFDQAFPILQQILKRSPNDLKARNLMGIALSATGRREEANEHFKKVLAVEPKFVPALKNLALNELALGRTEDARLHFEAALKSAPQDLTCHWGLAEIAFAARDFQRAVIHYEQSADLALKDSRVMAKFANSCLEAKQLTKAAALLEKIPWETDAHVHFQVGLMLARLEKFGAAARRFELALSAARSQSSIVKDETRTNKQWTTGLDTYQVGYNLVLVLIRNHDYAAAIRTAEEMLTAEQRTAELYNLLAQAYENSGKTKQAYDALRAATELEPHDETNYLDLILLCVEHANHELGLEIADIGLRRVPSSHRLHLQRGVVLAMKERFAEAADEFRASAQLSPEAGLPHVALGLVLMQMEKVTEAIEVLRRQSRNLSVARSPLSVVKDQTRTNEPRTTNHEPRPDDAYVFWFLGEALDRFGIAPRSEEEKEAIAALEKSIQVDPRLPQARALLGKLLLRRGEIDRAARELEKAVELDPEDLAATYQLAQALQRKGQTARAKQLFDKVEKAKTAEPPSAQRTLLRIIKARSQ